LGISIGGFHIPSARTEPILHSLEMVAMPPLSGYNVARVRYAVILSPEAVDDLRALKANIRAVVREAIEEHLRYEPNKTSKSRIKRLRGLSRPQYRLRVEGVRVFYDVTETTVEILAILSKEEADEWLEKAGE
jgi:mRNA interferase RelE/StbE